jgi:hypothetical protein
VSSPTDSRAALENAEAGFEEATDHVRRREPFTTLRLGPTVPLSLARLRPGTIGWSRSVLPGPTRSAKTPPGATLYYVLFPTLETTGEPDDLEGPFADQTWTDFSFAEPVRGSPRAMLLLQVVHPRGAKALGPFAEAVRSELESDSD